MEVEAGARMGRGRCRAALLKLEEDWIKGVCATIAGFKPDVVVTEKGLSDLAMHFLTQSGISAIRRLRKTGAPPHPLSLLTLCRSRYCNINQMR